MELLLIGIYVSLCYVIFKIFRIPVNQWSLSTAALGGIIGIVLILLLMNYNHPFTANARIYFAVTPVLPSVKGRVIEVPVATNTPLKEGDELVVAGRSQDIRQFTRELETSGSAGIGNPAAQSQSSPGKT